MFMKKYAIVLLLISTWCKAQNSWIFQDSSADYQSTTCGVELPNLDILTILLRPKFEEDRWFVNSTFLVLHPNGTRKTEKQITLPNRPYLYLYNIKLFADYFIAFGAAGSDDFTSEQDYVMLYYNYNFELIDTKLFSLPIGQRIPYFVRVSDISNDQFVIASKSFTDSTHTKTNNYMILVNKNGDLLNSYFNKPNEAQSWQFFKRSLYDEIVSFTPEIFYFDKLLNLKAKTQSSSYISQILSSQDMAFQKSIDDELVFTLFPDSETIRYGIFNINSLRVLATGSTQKDNFRTPAFGNSIAINKEKNIFISGCTGQSSLYQSKLFVTKHQPSSTTVEWDFEYSTTKNLRNTCVVACQDGGVIWIGTGSDINLNPKREVLIVKIDKDGNVITNNEDITKDKTRYSIIEKTIDQTLVIKTNEIPLRSQLSLFDIYGKVICTKSIFAFTEHHIIETRQLPSSIYFYSIETEGKNILSGQWIK